MTEWKISCRKNLFTVVCSIWFTFVSLLNMFQFDSDETAGELNSFRHRKLVSSFLRSCKLGKIQVFETMHHKRRRLLRIGNERGNVLPQNRSCHTFTLLSLFGVAIVTASIINLLPFQQPILSNGLKSLVLCCLIFS